jgi:hypothetical protein
MSQRVSGYERKPDESYETIAWPVVALLARLPSIRRAWDPCHGGGQLIATLRRQGVEAVGTSDNFFARIEAPLHVSHLVTNPPYGPARKSELAVRFIEHALELNVPHIAMLLRVDFDSAVTRQHLFRDCPAFVGKIVLLNRIKWFEGPSSPSDNHAWYLWDRNHRGPPIIQYITKYEANASMVL